MAPGILAGHARVRLDDGDTVKLLSIMARRRGRIALVMAVFLVFLLNAVGALNMGPGLSLHLPVLTDLVTGGPVPRVLHSLDFLVLTLCGLTLALALPLLSPLASCALTGLVGLAPFAVELLLPAKASFIPFQYTLLVIMVLFGLNVLLSWLHEAHRRQRLMKVFGTYVPPELVAGLDAADEPLSTEGQAREMTVLFCDIKGFTGISEHMEPRELARMLNAYFTAMTEVIYRHGGTIDKYIGDAIMAFWGAPLPQPDHARRALAAALDMQQEIRAMDDTFRLHDWPPVRIGVGLNTGTMNVGHMGSKYRMAYTVVGDAVNLAARLENLTRGYAADIIVSQSTREAIADLPFLEMDRVRVKGKGNPTRIYEPLPAEVAGADWLARHDAAMTAYYAREWPQAASAFGDLADDDTRRSGYYMALRTRCLALAESPPGADWDGSIQAPNY